MRYIEKGEEPNEFITWKAQEDKDGKFQRMYDTSSEIVKASQIWDLLPSSPMKENRREEGILYYSKEELRNTLINEQGGICCYCGQKIKNDETTKLEHLDPKSVDKRTTFLYSNIYASCEGGNSIVYTVKKDGELLGDIIDLLRIDVNTIHALNPNVVLQHLEEGEKITYQILEKHCDAKKSNIPITVKPNQIDCELKFGYKPSGEIYSVDSNDTNTISTIKKLGLNENKRLINIRASAWKRATDRIGTLKLLTSTPSSLKSLLMLTYESLNKKNEEGLLSECCFIERFVLGKFLN